MQSCRRIVIWAHSICPSTAALYREIGRQSTVPVLIKVLESEACRRTMERRAAYGQSADLAVYPGPIDWHPGDIQVFCSYQANAWVRQAMISAKLAGCRVVVYSEAPCEMCVGPKAWLKRLYYRWILPHRLKKAVAAADLIISQSGRMGVDRLQKIGWKAAQILPFGYYPAPVYDTCAVSSRKNRDDGDTLRVLHLGREDAYRGISTVLRACAMAKRRGISVELRRTGGFLNVSEVGALLDWCDVVVAAGLCEPWGIRVNEVLLAGRPIFVSDGMGAAWLVERYGCGRIFHAGSAKDLLRCFELGVTPEMRKAVQSADLSLRPSTAAKKFLQAISPELF